MSCAAQSTATQFLWPCFLSLCPIFCSLLGLLLAPVVLTWHGSRDEIVCLCVCVCVCVYACVWCVYGVCEQVSDILSSQASTQKVMISKSVTISSPHTCSPCVCVCMCHQCVCEFPAVRVCVTSSMCVCVGVCASVCVPRLLILNYYERCAIISDTVISFRWHLQTLERETQWGRNTQTQTNTYTTHTHTHTHRPTHKLTHRPIHIQTWTSTHKNRAIRAQQQETLINMCILLTMLCCCTVCQCASGVIHWWVCNYVCREGMECLIGFSCLVEWGSQSWNIEPRKFQLKP